MHNWAFLSYSRNDAGRVARLHRALERVRITDGTHVPYGLRPNRLRPVFRDLDDLSASSDLTAALRKEIQESHALVVACSPSAAT